MTDGVLKRLAQLERRHRQAGEHREIGHVEQRWADVGEYHGLVKELMVAAGLPTWPADTDGTEWLASRGLTAEVVVVRIDALMAEYPQLKGVGRAEAKSAVLAKPASIDDKVAAWRTLNGGGAGGTP